MSDQIMCDECGITVSSEKVGAIVGWLRVAELGLDIRTHADADRPRKLHFCRPEHVTTYFLRKFGTQT